MKTKNSTDRWMMKGYRRLVLDACEVRTRDHTPIRARTFRGPRRQSIFQHEDAECFLNQQVQKNARDHLDCWLCRVRDEAFGLDGMIRGLATKLTIELACVVQLLHLIGTLEMFWGFLFIRLSSM